MKIRDGFQLMQEPDGTHTAVYLYFGLAKFPPKGFIRLNALGTFLWKKLAKECTTQELVSAVVSKYDVDEKTAARDVGSFIDKLIDTRVLEDVKREFLVDTRHNVFYLVNFKAACSSVKAAMFETFYPDNYSVHGINNSEEFIKVKMNLTEAAKYEDSFTFVRNPYDRLVSAYESKYHHDKIFSRKAYHMDVYLQGYMAEDRGFDDFVHRICQIPDLYLDGHFHSQYLYTHYPNGRPVVKHIGRYETINEEFPAIAEKYGYRQLPHYNNSGGAERDWRTYYTLETAELVHEKYKMDFEAFDYEDSYTELMEYLRSKRR